MPHDPRELAAKYYDLQSNPVDDIPFYLQRVGSSTRVLELGCGTGRVTLPLAQSCGYILGIDSSPAMLAICREKLAQAKYPESKARAMVGDVASFDLGETFDLVIAPFRVFQNLETDTQVSGFFSCIRRHLAPGGAAIVNTFRPLSTPAQMQARWAEPIEERDETIDLPDGFRLECYSRRARHQEYPLVLYPELIYRIYSTAGELQDEVVLQVPLRCWYPDELEQVVEEHGFRIVNRRGGYSGQAWGAGPELVIEFADK